MNEKNKDPPIPIPPHVWTAQDAVVDLRQQLEGWTRRNWVYRDYARGALAASQSSASAESAFTPSFRQSSST